MRRMIGAIFRQTVPATIIRSDWRGDARKTPAPKRSMSYRDDTVAIISMAQHASPNVIGQSDPLRHQLMAQGVALADDVRAGVLRTLHQSHSSAPFFQA